MEPEATHLLMETVHFHPEPGVSDTVHRVFFLGDSNQKRARQAGVNAINRRTNAYLTFHTLGGLTMHGLREALNEELQMPGNNYDQYSTLTIVLAAGGNDLYDRSGEPLAGEQTVAAAVSRATRLLAATKQILSGREPRVVFTGVLPRRYSRGGDFKPLIAEFNEAMKMVINGNSGNDRAAITNEWCTYICPTDLIDVSTSFLDDQGVHLKKEAAAQWMANILRYVLPNENPDEQEDGDPEEQEDDELKEER